MLNLLNTALIIIDQQLGLDHPKLGPRNNPDAEMVMHALPSPKKITSVQREPQQRYMRWRGRICTENMRRLLPKNALRSKQVRIGASANSLHNFY